MGHAAKEDLLNEAFPLGAHDNHGDVLSFQGPHNSRDWVPWLKAVTDHGDPGFQKTLLPLPQQVPGRPRGDLLVARRIGFFSSRYTQRV